MSAVVELFFLKSGEKYSIFSIDRILGKGGEEDEEGDEEGEEEREGDYTSEIKQENIDSLGNSQFKFHHPGVV